MSKNNHTGEKNEAKIAAGAPSALSPQTLETQIQIAAGSVTGAQAATA